MDDSPVTTQPVAMETGTGQNGSTTESYRQLLGRNESRKRSALRRRKMEEVSDDGDDDDVRPATMGDLLSAPCRVAEQAAEQAEEFVKKVIEAGWQVVHHHHLPEWLQDNEHIVEGHRPQINSFRACFRSVFRLHTETGNIWTHLIGMIVFITLFVSTLRDQYTEFTWQDITVHSVFFCGLIACLTFSWTFHTVFCHSPEVSKLFSKLDYCGITLLVVGSLVPWLYYSFYCQFQAHMIYLVASILLGGACIMVSLWDKFSTPDYRTVRATMFIALGLTGAIPAGHFVLRDGVQHAFDNCGFGSLVLMAVLYISGAVIYALRIPERIFPGKFDIWFQSHQIFHVAVVAAAFVHIRGLQTISAYRLANTECPGLS